MFLKRIVRFLKEYRPPKFFFFFCLLLPLLLCFKVNMKLDNDSWFLIRSGRYVLEQGIPYIEPFTMHQNFDFVMQQWLGSTIFALIYNHFGALGVAVFVTLLEALFLFLFYRLCKLVSNQNSSLSMILTFVIGILMSNGFFVARPQIFSFIIYVLLFYCLESYIRKKKIRYLFALPVLSFLEINLHGSIWWMLICFMIPYLIDSFSFSLFGFHTEGYRKKPLFLAFFSMIFVAFLNPYGTSMLTYLFIAYTCPYLHNMIVEMNPPTVKTVSGILTYATILIVLLLYFQNKKKPIKMRYFLLLIGTVLLALTARRSFSFFLIASLFPLADYFKEKGKIKFASFPKKGKIISIATLSVVFLFSFFVVSRQLEKTHSLDGAVNYLNQNTQKDDIVLYTHFDDGSYLEFQGYHPYIDPRAEVFLKEMNHQYDVLGEFYRLQYIDQEEEIKDFLNHYSFTHILVQEKDVLWDYLEKDSSYQLVYQDEKYKIYTPKEDLLL